MRWMGKMAGGLAVAWVAGCTGGTPFQRAERACVAFAACGVSVPELPTGDYGTCVAWILGSPMVDQAVVSCAASAAARCDAVLPCVGFDS